MKKVFFAISIALFSLVPVSAQLPYSKMMGLSYDLLIEKNFKYDKKKNQYVLTKTDGWNATMNVVTALSGQAATDPPSKTRLFDNFTIWSVG